MQRSHLARLVAGITLAALLGAACGDDDDAASSGDQTTSTTDETQTTDDPATTGDATATPAADLRATLEFALQEHVYLAGAATGAAIGGRQDEFDAAAATLDANSDDIIGAVGSVYGMEAQDAFDPLWRKHIGFFVDYTTGVANDDTAMAEQAVSDLTAYADEFGAFIESATDGGLEKAAVADLLTMHATSLIGAIDAQDAGDAEEAFTSLKEAASHMTMIAGPLAGAIAEEQGLEGDPSSDASTLRSILTTELQEHVYLAGAATGAAIGGRQDEFDAAAATLDANSDDIIGAVGSVYGMEAQDAFDPLWRKHIGFFVDYTTGVANDDTAMAEQAVDLTAYADEFGAFIESATDGGLEKAAVADLLTMHATSLIGAIDAQDAGDAEEAFTSLKEAASHMTMIADPLAAVIASQNSIF